MSAGPQELVVDAPLWLALAPLVLALWWWASRSGGAQEQPTGAFEVWRELAGAAPREARRRWRFSPRAAWIALGLFAALLALAQPSARRLESPTSWRAIVDAGPAMRIEDGASRTRGDAALERAREQLANCARPGDSVEWWLVSGTEVLEQRAEFPADWPYVEQARWGLRSPDWTVFDAPGTLWVSAESLAVAPRFAGASVSARSTSEGVVAAWPGQRLALRAGQLALEATRSPRVFLAPELEGGVLARGLDAWARARGVERVALDDELPGALELRILAAQDAARAPASGARDGWRLSGPAASVLPARAGASVWLSDERAPAAALVSAGRGWIVCGLDARAQLEGDGASFAIAWAQLLDQCLLPVDALAPLDALQDRGPAFERAPTAPQAAGVAPRRWAHVLALGAAVCALAALFARR